MKNRRKQGKIFRSLLAVLMLTAMLVTSVLQPVFAGDYEAGKTGNLTLTVQQADEEGNQTPLPDVGLTIYKVGSVNFDGNVHFVLDEHWLLQQSILIPSRRLMAGMKRQRSWRL